MKSSENIIFRGVDLTVHYGYEEGQELILRPDPDDCQEGLDPYIEIHEVHVGEREITGLFSDKDYDEMVTALLDALKERAKECDPY